MGCGWTTCQDASSPVYVKPAASQPVPHGKDSPEALGEGYNYATILLDLDRWEEAKALLRKLMPVARRALGASHDYTLRMRTVYASSLYADPAATLDDIHEAVTTLEDAGRIARRALGGAHPTTDTIGRNLRKSRALLAAMLSAHETPPSSA